MESKPPPVITFELKGDPAPLAIILVRNLADKNVIGLGAEKEFKTALIEGGLISPMKIAHAQVQLAGVKPIEGSNLNFVTNISPLNFITKKPGRTFD